MSSNELAEWMAYYALEPFGSETKYIGSAIVAATIQNSNRGKNDKVCQPSDFIPEFGKYQSENHQIQIAEAMTMALGGSDQRAKVIDE